MLETNRNIFHVCHRVHVVRIKSQNVVDDIIRNLRFQGFTVTEKPHYRAIEIIGKADTAATMGQLGVIQVAGQQSGLRANRTRENLQGRNQLHPLPGNPVPHSAMVYTISRRFFESGNRQPMGISCNRWIYLPLGLLIQKSCSKNLGHPGPVITVKMRYNNVWMSYK